MKPIRILTALAMVGAAYLYYNHTANATHPLAATCLNETDGLTAVELCKTALASDELAVNERGDVAFGIGYLLHDADPVQAVRYYSIAAEVYPEKTTAFHNRGMLLQEIDQHQLAIRDFTVAIDRMEAGGRVYDGVYWRRAYSYDQNDQDDLALADYERQVALTPNHARLYSNMAIIHRHSGDHDRARDLVEQAAILAPDDSAVIKKHINILKAQEDFDALVLVMVNAVGHHPDNVWMWREKSFAEGKAGLFHDALVSIDRALDIGPETRWAWSQRGWILTQLDRDVAAYGAYSMAYDIAPNHRATNRKLVELREDMFARAVAGDPMTVMQPYLDAYPDDFDIALRAIDALSEVEDFDTALRLCETSAGLADDQYLCDLTALTKHVRHDDFAAALIAAHRAVDHLRPEGPARVLYRERVAEATDDAARGVVQNHLEGLERRYLTAVNNRAVIHVELGNERAALADRDMLVALNPSDMVLFEQRADTQAKFGNHRAAIDDLSVAIETYEQQDDAAVLRRALYARFKSYYAHGNRLAASDDLYRVIAGHPDLIEKVQTSMRDSGTFSGEITGEMTPAFTAALRACVLKPDCKLF